MSRAGFEPQWGAAGSPFKHGVPEDRALYIDGPQMPRKRSDPLDSVDRNGVAGNGPPRTEFRALMVDDLVRRAHSAPPAKMPSRAEVELALQAFGVPCNSDNLHSHRRGGSPKNVETRMDVTQNAAKFSDILGMRTRRHFHGSLVPGSRLSPRLAAATLDEVCIDAHRGRKHSKPRVASPEKDTRHRLTEQQEYFDRYTRRHHAIGHRPQKPSATRKSPAQVPVRERERVGRLTTSVKPEKPALPEAPIGGKTRGLSDFSTASSESYGRDQEISPSSVAGDSLAMHRVIASLRSHSTAAVDIALSGMEQHRSDAVLTQQVGHLPESVRSVCDETTSPLADSEDPASSIHLGSLGGELPPWPRQRRKHASSTPPTSLPTDDEQSDDENPFSTIMEESGQPSLTLRRLVASFGPRDFSGSLALNEKLQALEAMVVQ